MLSWKIKSVVAMLAVVTLVQAVPQDADAFIFRWLRRRRAERIAYYQGYAPAVAYRPTIPQPACGSCNACPTPCVTTQRVCSYCPQTSYRTVYRQVPVTVYRPVTAVDPCTGCQTTTMHPCTTVQHVAQRVPVTTYRQVCQVVQRPVVAASPVVAAPMVQQQFAAPVQQYAAPVQQFAPAAPGCTNCGSPPIPAAPYAPAPATQLSPIPSPAGPTTNLAPGPASGNNGAPANTIPMLPSAPQQPQSTYQGSDRPTSTPVPFQPRVQHPEIRPLPDLERAPALLNPDDRTALRSSVAPGSIVPISWETSAKQPVSHSPARAKPKTRRLDDGGWRPARSF